jgi:organic radical activating enzyme
MNGGMKPCCFGKQDFGNVNDGNWDYFNSTNTGLTVLKQALLDNDGPEYCTGCEEHRWYSTFKKIPIHIEKTADFALTSIDARWGNTCQLSCTYCDSYNSSTWGKLEKQIAVPSRQHAPRKFRDKIQPLFDFILENATRLQRVSLVGGEPLLLKENARLLELLPDSVVIDIITNLAVDLENNEVYNELIKRSNVIWHVSMENVGDRFEFVRRGATWKKQIQNLHKLENDLLGDHQHIELQSQYCAYTALNVRELYAFANEFTRVIIGWSTGLFTPPSLNFFQYPKQFKELALEELDFCINEYNDPTGRLIEIRLRLINSMDTVMPNIVEDCIEFHRVQEGKYFENRFNFLQLWPQYAVK